jgi:AsmA protein
MRALKILGIALGGLVLLFVLLTLSVRMFVDPNDYKDRIAQAVKKSTGREVALPGEIKLAVFPWLALELGPASLGNPPGFGAEPFVAVQHVALRVKLLPLLRKRLQIGRIEVDGLDLRLLKNAQGAANWQGFGGESATASSRTASPPGEMLSELGSVLIKDSRLRYQDVVADHVSLEVGRAASGLAVPVRLKLDLTTHSGGQPIALAGSFDVVPDFAGQQYRLAPVELSGTVSPGSNAAALPWKVSLPELSLDLAAQTARAPGFAAQLADARLAGSVLGEKILDAPRISGTFKLEPVGLRDLMRRFGVTPPETRDPKALSRLAASGEFAFGGNAVRATKLVVQLDDSTLRGDAAVTDLDTKAMSADFALDRIDLDRYMSPPKPGTAARPGDLPTTGLRALRMSGQFAIGSATILGLDIAQIRLTLVAKDGIVHISPALARLYGGNYSGDITLDDRGALPAMKVDQSMTGIDVAPLLRDLAKIERISGHGTVTSKLTARGRTSEQVLKSLNGHVAAELADGAVDGIDLWFEVKRALALIQQQTLPAGDSSGRTKFDTFKASADLKDGVASSRDLTIVSQNLRVSGQGTVNLANDAISYQAKATVLKEAPAAHAAAGAVLADIPLTITGTLTSPQVRPDLAGIAKARVQQVLDKNKEQLQQKLEDQLKGLFK